LIVITKKTALDKYLCDVQVVLHLVKVLHNIHNIQI